MVAELAEVLPPSNAEDDNDEVSVEPGMGRRRLAERGTSKMALPRFCDEFNGDMVVQQAIYEFGLVK
jgi:hypothetical protein